MRINVYGRQTAKESLDKYYHSAQSEFIAVFGRRRVGKTFLIREYFEQEMVFQFSGMANSSQEIQLQRFSQTLARYTGSAPHPISNWLDAFFGLEQYIEHLPSTAKKVVFIDELPWIDTPKSGFISALEAFWNGWASIRKDILLIVCGSVTSWMVDNLINNHGGLYGRLTGQIPLQPFTLKECEEYFQGRGLHLSRYEICEAYMVFGGIPYYLNFIDPQRSLSGSIDFALFNPNGPLYDEYSHLFPAMFRRSENYEKVVNILAQRQYGMTRNEIIEHTHLSSGESLTRVLSNLERCGFIRKYSPLGTKDKLYQLI
ncbi:MAG: ATP-binding protein, partial [Paludibacteraceae bacterium]|nr:ATP-binding protein [Paludibacteraceae bacterium]